MDIKFEGGFKMKKLLSIFLVLLMVTTLIIGCKAVDDKAANDQENNATNDEKDVDDTKTDGTMNQGETSDEVITLRFLGYNSESSRATYLKFLDEQLPNIKIQYEFVETANFSNVLNAQLSAQSGPDIIEGGSDTKLLAKAGYLYDLSNEDFVNLYSESGTGTYTVDGKLYATPLQSWFLGIMYNKTIFAENSLNVPTSIDEFYELSNALNDKGIKPMAIGGNDGDTLAKHFMGMALNYFYNTDAGKGFDDSFNNGEAKISENWGIPATQYEKFSKIMYEEKILGISAAEALDQFAKGEAAMLTTGPWDVNAIKEKNPTLEFGMFPFQGEAGTPGYLIGGTGSGLAVNADSEHIAEVLEVLKLTATPEAQAALIKDNTGSSYLAGVEVKMDAIYDDCQGAFKVGNVYAPWVNWMTGNPTFQGLSKSLQEVLIGSKTMTEAMEDADAINSDILEAVAE